MKKQSNTYTIIYIIVLVAIVGTLLAVTSMSLKEKQQENADADKMKQILASVHVATTDSDVKAKFEELITKQIVVDSKGTIIGSDAFDVNVAGMSKEKDIAKRQLPVYLCNLGEKGTKYILPVYGSGLWGPIWGYVALDSDGSTIYGAYFAHQGETPGLGAEIEKPAFSDQFDGKQMFKNNEYLPVAVVKRGQKAPNGEDFVDAVSGGTITSKGVSQMLSDCLTPYRAYLETLHNK